MTHTTKQLICIALCGVIYLCTPSVRACEPPEPPCHNWDETNEVWVPYGCKATPCTTEDCEYCNETSCECEPTCVDPIAEFDVTGYADEEDIVVPVGTSLTFDASDSCDPDATTLRYGWDFGDGGSDAGESVTYTFTEGGEWTVELVVLDSDNTECNEDCPDHYDDATREISVVKVDRVILDGVSPEDEGPIEIISPTSSVYLEAMPYPANATWPDEEPTWTIDGPPGSSPTVSNGYAAGLTVGGDYTVTAKCGSSDIGDSITITVVVSIEKVVEKGTSDEGPIVVGAGTVVELEAIPDPSTASFPDEEPEWAMISRPAGFPVPGWVSGSHEFASVGGLTIPGDYVVEATYGTSSDSITVTVFEVTEIRFRHPSVWKVIDEDYKFLGVFTDDTVTFGVVTEPPGITLPDGSLTWGGDASGDGEAASVTFTPEGSHTVTVSPSTGTGSTITANIVVQDAPAGLDQDAYLILNPVEAFIAWNLDLRGDAETWSEATYGAPPTRNNITDAARHALWMCLVARYCGAWFATGLGEAHEVHGPGPHTEGTMDMHNNAQGVAIEANHTHNGGGDQACCENAVAAAIADGTLWYLDEDHDAANTDEDGLLQPTDE